MFELIDRSKRLAARWHRNLWTPEEDDRLRGLIAAAASVILIIANKSGPLRREECVFWRWG
jgi:hypothetical protein